MSFDYAEAARLIRKGRRAERRGKAMSGCITGLITSVLLTFLKGWLFMLAIGIAHHDWWPTIPPIGFWASVLFMAVLPSLGGYSTKKNDD
jgi:drug/metabolite transporter (DMT)-like permease